MKRERSADHEQHPYTYRRPLDRPTLLRALGIAAVAGTAAFYLASVMLERTPLLEEDEKPRGRRPRRRGVPNAPADETAAQSARAPR
jgi:hypothetical protein